jgi:hypothetical protein
MQEGFLNKAAPIRSGQPEAEADSKACAACSAPEATKLCGRCRERRYCSAKCQKQDWGTHKQFCNDYKHREDERRLMKVGAKTGWPEVQQNRFYVVCDTIRNGTADFCSGVEFTYYPPCKCRSKTPNTEETMLEDLVHEEGCGNDQANKLEMHYQSFQSMFYAVLSVPLEDAGLVMDAARQLGMKVCDGVPTMINSGRRNDFPLQGRNVWSLENRERPATAMSQEDQLEQLRALMKGERPKGNGPLVLDFRGGNGGGDVTKKQ